MINSLLLFVGFLLLISLILTLLSIVNKDTSALGELRITATTLGTNVLYLISTLTTWVKDNLSFILSYGIGSLLVVGGLAIAVFFISFVVSHKTQLIAEGVNNTLAGPVNTALGIADNISAILAEAGEPAILVWDGYVGLLRILAQPAIDIALECPDFSWIDLAWNTVDILTVGLTSISNYVSDLLDPTSPTAGYFDLYSILLTLAQSVSKIMEILKCECRMLSFYFEYLATLIVDPNLWFAVDRAFNFFAVLTYQISANFLAFLEFLFALLTGQWSDVADYFFDNAYSYPDWFEISTIVRDFVHAFLSFYDQVEKEIIKLVAGFIPFDVSGVYPEYMGGIIGNILGTPIQLVGEAINVRSHFLTVVTGNYGGKFHEDFDVLKRNYYEIVDTIADFLNIPELPTLPEISCAIRHIGYGVVLIWEGLVHTAINAYTVLVQAFWSFTVPVSFGDLIIDSRILGIVDDIKENSTEVGLCLQNVTDVMQQEELGIAFVETTHWYNSNVQFFTDLLKKSRLANWSYYTATLEFEASFEQKYNETEMMAIAWGNFFRSLSILDNCTANIIPHVNTSNGFPYPATDPVNDVFCCLGGTIEAVIKEVAGLYRVAFRVIYEFSRTDNWVSSVQTIVNGSTINISKELRGNVDRTIEYAGCLHPLIWIVAYSEEFLPVTVPFVDDVLTCYGGPLSLDDLLADTFRKFLSVLAIPIYVMDFVLHVMTNYVSTDTSLYCQNSFSVKLVDECFCYIFDGLYSESLWRLQEFLISYFKIAECISNSPVIGSFVTVITDVFGPGGTVVDIICNSISTIISVIEEIAQSLDACKTEPTIPATISCIFFDYVETLLTDLTATILGILDTVVQDIVNYVKTVLSALANFFYCIGQALTSNGLNIGSVVADMTTCRATFVAVFTSPITIGNGTYNTTIEDIHDNCNFFFPFRPSGPTDGYACVKSANSTQCVSQPLTVIYGYCYNSSTYTTQANCPGCWEAVILDSSFDPDVDPNNCTVALAGGACCYAVGTACTMVGIQAQCDSPYNGIYTAGVTCAAGVCTYSCEAHTSNDQTALTPMPCEQEYIDMMDQKERSAMRRLTEKNYDDCMLSYNLSKTINGITGYRLASQRFSYDAKETYLFFGNFMEGVSYTWHFYQYRNMTPAQFFSMTGVDDTNQFAHFFINLLYGILSYIDVNSPTTSTSSSSWFYNFFGVMIDGYTLFSQLYDMESLLAQILVNTTFFPEPTNITTSTSSVSSISTRSSTVNPTTATHSSTVGEGSSVYYNDMEDELTPADLGLPSDSKFYDKLVKKPWFSAAYNHFKSRHDTAARELKKTEESFKIISTIYNNRVKWRKSGSDPMTQPYPQYTTYETQNILLLNQRIQLAAAHGDSFAVNHWTSEKSRLFPAIPAWVPATNDCDSRPVWDPFGRIIGTCSDETLFDCTPTPLSDGACCFADGNCTIATDVLNCTGMGGLVFRAGATCDPEPSVGNLTVCSASWLPDASYGACCFNKTCSLVVEEDCVDGGLFSLGKTCWSSDLDASCEYCTSAFWPDVDISANIFCPRLPIFYASSGFTMTPCDERSCYSVDGSSSIGSCMTKPFGDFNPFPDSLRNPVCTCNMTGVAMTTACCLTNGTSYFTNNTIECSKNGGLILQNEPLASCPTLLLIESDPVNYGACCDTGTCSVTNMTECAGTFTPGMSCANPNLPAECDHCAAQGCRECEYALRVINNAVDIMFVIRNEVLDIGAMRPGDIQPLPMRPGDSELLGVLPVFNTSVWQSLWDGMSDPDFDFSSWLLYLFEETVNYIVQEWLGYPDWDVRDWINQDLAPFFDTSGTEPTSFIVLVKKYSGIKFISSCDPMSDVILNENRGYGLIWGYIIALSIFGVISIIIGILTKNAFTGLWGFAIIYFGVLGFSLAYDIPFACIRSNPVLLPVAPYLSIAPLPMLPRTLTRDIYDDIIHPLFEMNLEVCPDCTGPEFPVCHQSPYYFTTVFRNFFYLLRWIFPRLYCEFDNTLNPLLYGLVHTIPWIERQYDFTSLGYPTCADLMSDPGCSFWLLGTSCPTFVRTPEFQFCFWWTSLNWVTGWILLMVLQFVSLISIVAGLIAIYIAFLLLRIFWLFIFSLAPLLSLPIVTYTKKRDLTARGLLKRQADLDVSDLGIALPRSSSLPRATVSSSSPLPTYDTSNVRRRKVKTHN